MDIVERTKGTLIIEDIFQGLVEILSKIHKLSLKNRFGLEHLFHDFFIKQKAMDGREQLPLNNRSGPPFTIDSRESTELRRGEN